MAGFRNVRPPTREMASNAAEHDRQRGMISAPQVADLGGGKFYATSDPKEHGDISPNYYDDPTVNALAKLPSEQAAAQYAGTKPSFYGVQRPGDYQRVIQRQMAADALPGGREQLAKLIDARVQNARRGYAG